MMNFLRPGCVRLMIGIALAQVLILQACVDIVCGQTKSQRTQSRRVDQDKKVEVEKPKPIRSASRPVVGAAANASAAGKQTPQGKTSQPQTSQEAAAKVPIDLLVQNQPVVLRAEAYAGEPYGVGKLTFRLRAGDEMIQRVGGALLTDTENRVFYPIISNSPVKTFFQTITGNRNNQPDDVQTIWFLFKGQNPLKFTLQGSGGTAFEVPVEFARTRQFARHVNQWWSSFTRVVDGQIEESEYPPLVETYLKTLLGKRMGLELSLIHI